MKFRLSCLVILLSCLVGCDRSDRLETLWRQYRTHFVAADGRIIDTGNEGISHSEGQGYGMLFAVAAKDRQTFEQIWQWTRSNLQVRSDHLFIWRRRPDTPVAKEDPNNATDGDLLIAWALLEAAETWKEPSWRRQGRHILEDLKSTVIRSWQKKPVLLPAAAGFEREKYLILNLSYWVFPALTRFASLDADPIWQALIQSGLELIHRARFGAWQLPADWVEVSETLRPWRERQARFGYDAIRIPLYLVWSGHIDNDRLAPYRNFWENFDTFVPPWIDLTANCVGAYRAPPGIRAVSHLTHHAAGEEWRLNLPRPDQDYYSASLVLLSHMAAHHVKRRSGGFKRLLGASEGSKSGKTNSAP